MNLHRTLIMTLLPFFLSTAVCSGEILPGRITGNNYAHRELLVEAAPALGLLGIEVPELCSRLGTPDEVYPLRGESEAQDDVVFAYSEGVSLFVFRNRVWQVRIQPAYGLDGALTFFSSREQTVEMLGAPFAAIDDSFIYLLPDRGYPVRLRIYFSERGMDDIYLYRADF